jgi:hypothetical protein
MTIASKDVPIPVPRCRYRCAVLFHLRIGWYQHIDDLYQSDNRIFKRKTIRLIVANRCRSLNVFITLLPTWVWHIVPPLPTSGYDQSDLPHSERATPRPSTNKHLGGIFGGSPNEIGSDEEERNRLSPKTSVYLSMVGLLM